MSFAEVLQELPSLTFSQRQLLIRRALDLDDPALSPADEVVVGERLAAHRDDPASAVPLETMNDFLTESSMRFWRLNTRQWWRPFFTQRAMTNIGNVALINRTLKLGIEFDHASPLS